MNMEEKRQKELIKKASLTNCPDELWEFHLSKIMNVRRAVARNRNISEKIANNLVSDPVLNVSYMAVQNPKSTLSKNFGEHLTSCVICEKDEHTIDCIACESKNKSSF